MFSLFSRLQRNPAKLVTKVKGLRGLKTRVRVGRESLPLKPKTLPRVRKLQLRQKKQRPRLKKLILRPRMLLPLGQASKKTLMLPRLRLST